MSTDILFLFGSHSSQFLITRLDSTRLLTIDISHGGCLFGRDNRALPANASLTHADYFTIQESIWTSIPKK